MISLYTHNWNLYVILMRGIGAIIFAGFIFSLQLPLYFLLLPFCDWKSFVKCFFAYVVFEVYCFSLRPVRIQFLLNGFGWNLHNRSCVLVIVVKLRYSIKREGITIASFAFLIWRDGWPCGKGSIWIIPPRYASSFHNYQCDAFTLAGSTPDKVWPPPIHKYVKKSRFPRIASAGVTGKVQKIFCLLEFWECWCLFPRSAWCKQVHDSFSFILPRSMSHACKWLTRFRNSLGFHRLSQFDVFQNHYVQFLNMLGVVVRVIKLLASSVMLFCVIQNSYHKSN